MSMPFGMPGPGGSLGTCAICGQNFLLEILMGRTVKTLHLDGVDSELFMHADCAKNIKDGMDWHDLPDGPLKSAYEKANKEPEKEPK